MSEKYWLMKSEPNVYSIGDLMNDKDQTTHWDGVRNYQARNFMRDEMKVGDRVLFYHSNTDPPAVVGTAKIVKEGYTDFTAFDPNNKFYDPKSNQDSPTWYMVDIRFETKFKEPIPLQKIKETPGLEDMKLIQRGMRLSVQPVTKKEWDIITKMSD